MAAVACGDDAALAAFMAMVKKPSGDTDAAVPCYTLRIILSKLSGKSDTNDEFGASCSSVVCLFLLPFFFTRFT